MSDIIDRANERAEQDLRRALSVKLTNIYANLRPARVCHNCGEPLADGNALFCALVVEGEPRPACAIDFERRHG